MTVARKALRRRGLPTYRELLSAPELAILSVLENAVDLAIVAMVAAQADLQPTPDGHEQLSSAAAEAADAIIARAQALVAAIATYRAALDREPTDLPF